ncbi:MAG: Gfa-like protein [Labilithrix sp.]|nr:Gfa-like protein [Labilithrix sp.]
MAFAKSTDFRLLGGADELTDYRHTRPSKAEPLLHLTFCRRCGVRPFSSGGALPQFGGEFYAVNVACLDDVTDEELAKAKIHFADGRNDRWDRAAAVPFL